MKTRLSKSLAPALLAAALTALSPAALIHHWTLDGTLADSGSGANPLVLRANAALSNDCSPVGGGSLVVNTATGTTRIGDSFNPATDRDFNGHLDDIRVYDNALATTYTLDVDGQTLTFPVEVIEAAFITAVCTDNGSGFPFSAFTGSSTSSRDTGRPTASARST